MCSPTSITMNYQQWLQLAQQELAPNQQNDPFLNPKTDAICLLQSVTGQSRANIFAFAETPLDEISLKKLTALLTRRLAGEPLAYILGEKEFWSLPLKVSPATLIPRPDTEILVEKALSVAQQQLSQTSCIHILDLGTGTGAIALALASELGHKAKIIGVDCQAAAVALAEENRQQLQLDNVRFLQSHWFEQLSEEKFHLIVSNPPYIDQEDIHLTQGDVRFEPLSALVAQDKGYADLKFLIKNAPHFLYPNGQLILEHGWQQGETLRQFFLAHQWQQVATLCDYGNNERITFGTVPLNPL